MRFYVYKSMLDMCNTLKEAAAYMHENNNTDLVEGCLDMLVSINTTLVEYNLTDFKSIAVLSEKLNSASINLPEIYDEIINLENEIKTKVKYKLHVLFVAELASKWDAMASVYEAMKKRDDCEVEVVIEPVFRGAKMPDGTVKSEIILNDYLTPMGIANVPYEQYDFAAKAPDITFFSQPYESCTVEKFWPENMAQFTKVVYLPYYTARTINKKKSNATYHSFFKAYTEKYAWKIIAQSETMKKHYKSFGSKKGENVIVTGLPKWDYPLKLTKENVKCPEGWKEKIEGRKVFLLNTHYTALLDNPINFEALKKLISTFMKNKKAALIWRPHPLTETVTKVHKSDFYEEYKKLKEKIKEAENIIYDEEPSYEASFVYSDALISNNSSIVVQFLLMNKPVLIAYNNKSIFEYRENLATNDGLFDMNKFPLACELADKKSFIEDIVNGKDEWENQRQELLEKYLTLADGKCGERVAEKIIEAFNNECEDREIEINPAKNVLVVGSLEDSLLCIKQLEKNGANFVLAEEFLNGEACEYDTISVFDVKEEQFDLFVVAEKNAAPIADMLKIELSVKAEKILPFWQLYRASLPTRICDRVMLDPRYDSYDGVILGLSNVEVGILSDRLKAKFCNLAVSSQDIYYNLKTLEYCCENYYEKLKTLKYAIIDLHDYNYFNYDNSKSVSAIKYLGFGGYNLDEHNFKKNKNYQGDYSSCVETLEKLKLEGVNEIAVASWALNFPDVHELNNFESFRPACSDLTLRKAVVTDEQINSYAYERGSIVKIFDQTVKENQKHLEDTLKLLYKINPEIKIYFTVMPKFVEIEALDANNLYKHKKIFFDTVDKMVSKYNVEFFDFKTTTDIMYNRNYFFDANHLNYYGALKVTDEINKRIFG